MDKIKERCEIEAKYKWDLTKIYKNEQEIENDVKYVLELKDKLLLLKDKVTKTSDNLYNTLDLFFSCKRTLEKLYCYANLLFNQDMNVKESQIIIGKMEKLYTTISSDTSFVMPEIIKEDYEIIEKFINENSKLREYKFTLEDLFREKSHILSAKEEKIIAKSGEIMSSSSNTYQMLTDTDFTYKKIHDENDNLIAFNESKYNKYIKSFDRRVRKEAFNSVLNEYKRYLNTITETLKGSIKTDSFIASVRNYDSVLSMELSQDNISEKLYEKLLNEVNDNINISHDYISLKKEVLNIDKLHLYDIYTPLVKDINKKYSYDEAIDLIYKALKPLGNEYLNDLKKIIESNCIDVYNNKGKAGGAYSSGTYDTLPYILTNFEGTFNDVSTLIHELGHSMHSYLSNTNNTYCNSSYSIFLAEIASTVNEVLLNRYCLSKATKKEEKLFYLNNLLDEIKACIIRQTLFAEFEKIIHEKDEEGNILTGEDMCKIYLKLNKKYYGKDVIYDKLIQYEWERIPHFYTSFYVYKYSTGMSVALTIANEILKGNEKARDNYITFLKSGGKDYPLNILKNVGINIENDDTIRNALLVFESTIKEFRKIYMK